MCRRSLTGVWPTVKRAGSIAALVLSIAACSRGPEKHLASGDASFQAGKYNEAVIHYRNAIQLNPKLAQAHHQLARTYLELKFWEAAYSELQETVALEPGNTEAQLRLAALLIAGKQYEDGKALVDKVLAANPNHPQAHALLGDQFGLTGDLDGAIREHLATIKLDPKHIASYAALAGIYASQGKVPAAETILGQAAESNPQSVLARLNLSKFYLGQKKFAEAKAEAVAASKLAPKDPNPLIMLVNVNIAEGNLTDAEKTCAQIKTSAPEDPEAYRSLASFYRFTEQRAKAVTELQSLRAAKPDDSWVKASLAETLLDLDRPTEAAIPIEELLTADAKDPNALMLKGRILIGERKYSDARTALEAALQSIPQSGSAWYFLGVAQKSLGLTESAKVSLAQARKFSPDKIAPALALAELDAMGGNYETAERLAQANPNVPAINLIGARAELARGNLGKAEQMLNTVLAREPGSLPALEILLIIQGQAGRPQEGVGRLSALVSESPKSAPLQLLLARAHFQAGDFSKAEASARQALALDSRIPDARSLLGRMDASKGLTEQAVANFKAEIEVNPYQVASHMALADLHEREGKWAEARSALENANKFDSRSPYVKNNLAYLYLEHGGDANAALSLALEAKRMLPESPLIADTLGWAYYKIGSYQSAIIQLSIATQKLPDNPKYHYHLGMAYLGAGRLEAATASLQRALKINSSFTDAASARAALNDVANKQQQQQRRL